MNEGKYTHQAAFPVTFTDKSGQIAPTYPGMSLLDYFSAFAMHAELNSSGANHHAAKALMDAAKRKGLTVEQRIAENAYRLAEAMMKEKAKYDF